MAERLLNDPGAWRMDTFRVPPGSIVGRAIVVDGPEGHHAVDVVRVRMGDLVRLIDLPLVVDFIGLSSYHQGRQTSGSIRVTHYPSSPLRGKDVLVVEDIVDTGLTTTFLLGYLKEQGPASIKLCSLTDKPSRRQVPVAIDYLGFTVPERFIVGYGIDYGEKFRNLKDICYVEEG